MSKETGGTVGVTAGTQRIHSERRTVHCSCFYEIPLGGLYDIDDLESLIVHFKTIMEEYPEMRDFRFDVYNDEFEGESLRVSGTRPENERELSERLCREADLHDERQRSLDRQEEDEYKKYLELRAKYEKGTVRQVFIPDA